MHQTGEYTISDLVELFSVSRPTVYRTIGRTDSWIVSPPDRAASHTWSSTGRCRRVHGPVEGRGRESSLLTFLFRTLVGTLRAGSRVHGPALLRRYCYKDLSVLGRDYRSVGDRRHPALG